MGLAAGAGCGPSAPDAGSQRPTELSSLRACGSGPLLDHLPLDLSEFRAFRPLGFVTPRSHVVPAWHSSFSRNLPGESRPAAQVRFPGAAVVVGIWEVEFRSSGQRGFQLRFAPCRDVVAYFNHLGSLSPRLLAAARAVPGDCREVPGDIRNCRHTVSVEVGSGEVVGLSDASAGVDLGFIDYRLPPAAFANPSHYTRDFFYYASPVSYFTPDLRAAMEARLASWDGMTPRTAEPRVGTHMHDRAGTAQGTWFTPGLNFVNAPDEDTMVALVHDYIGADEPVFSFGGRVAGLPAGVFSFPVEAAGLVNRDFSAVAADGRVYCYERFRSGRTQGGVPLGDPRGVLLLTMPTPTTLRIERRPSAPSCAQVTAELTPAAVSLER